MKQFVFDVAEEAIKAEKLTAKHLGTVYPEMAEASRRRIDRIEQFVIDYQNGECSALYTVRQICRILEESEY